MFICIQPFPTLPAAQSQLYRCVISQWWAALDRILKSACCQVSKGLGVSENPQAKFWSSLVAQWIKDPVLSLPMLELLLWCVFNTWPGNFHMQWERLKKAPTK